jgi:hypothetical protein
MSKLGAWFEFSCDIITVEQYARVRNWAGYEGMKGALAFLAGWFKTENKGIMYVSAVLAYHRERAMHLRQRTWKELVKKA